MSFLGRLGKMATGLYGAVEAPVGLVMDLAKSPFTDDPNLDGFFHTLVGRTTNRGAQFLGDVFGPQGAIGSTIGAVPEGLRNPVGDVIHPILNGDRWLYTNAISHPLATFLYVGALTDSQMWKQQGGASGWSTYLDPDAWSRAYKMTQHKSVGGALADDLNFGFIPGITGHHDVDILNQGEVNKFAGSDFYKAVSGVTDAAMSWEYDPLAHGLEGLKALKIAQLDRPLTAGMQAATDASKAALREGASAEEAAQAGSLAGVQAHSAQVSSYLKSARWDRLNEALGRINNQYADINARVGAIKDQIFPNHASGADIAAVMAQANTDAERELAMRVLMGENNATRLITSNPAMAEHLRAGFEQQSMIKDPTYLPDYHDSPSYRPDVNPAATIDAAKGGIGAQDRLQGLIGTIDREMKAPGPVDQLRIAAKQSEFYQHSAFTKPVRVFTNNVSTGMIDIADPNHIDQVERALREAGMEYETRLGWVGKMANAAPADRLAVIKEAETAAIQTIAERHGVAPEDLQQILEGGETYRNAAQKALADAQVDEHGNTVVQIPGLEEHTEIHLPGAVDPQNAYLMTNMKALDKQFGWWSQHGMDGVTKAPQSIVNSTMKVWRAGVLLRPAWPIRVVGEHGLAMMAKLDDLSYGMDHLRDTIKDYMSWKDGYKNAFHSMSEQLGLGWGGTTGAIFGGIVAGPLGAVAGGATGAGLQLLGRSLEEVPYHQFLVNGYQAHGAFGSALDKETLWRQLVSSRSDLDQALDRTRPDPRQLHATPPEDKVSTMPGHSAYPAQYEKAIAELQKDPLARVILAHDHGVPIYKPAGVDLAGMDGQQVGERWLQYTPEGRAHMAEVPVRAKDPAEWSGSMRELVHQMTAADPVIARKLLAGETVTHDDLVRAVADNRTRPIPEGFADHPSNVGGKLSEDIGVYGKSSDNGFYHTTTDMPGVLKDGLKSTDDLPKGKVGISGSGPQPFDYNQTHVSLTTDPAHAQFMADMLKLQAQAASGQIGHLGALEAFDKATGGLLTQIGPKGIHELLSDPSVEGFMFANIFHTDEELARIRDMFQGSGDSIRLRRFRAGGKFAAVKSMEDVASWMQQLGLDPLKQTQFLDTLFHQFENSHDYRGMLEQAAGPHQHYTGALVEMSPEELRQLDAAKIGAVKVAVRKGATSEVIGHDEGYPEVAIKPNDLSVVRPLRPEGFPEPQDMPVVHPEYQAQVTGKSPAVQGIHGVVENLFKALGTIPLDELINDRYFAWVYRREMERRLTGLAQGAIDDSVLRGVEQDARATALQSMRHLMYDFANRSEFADMVRSVMPFFPAWQQTLQRWGGIALENPTFIRRAQQVLAAPGKMGITWKDPDTHEEYVRLRLPGFASSLLGHGFLKGALDDQGYVKFQTKGLSMAGEGMPGFGPWVDVALQPFVKDHPDLISSLKMVYPFGSTPDNLLDTFLPPNFQRLAAINDNDARSFRSAYNQIIISRLVKMDTGELPKLNLNDPGIRAKFLADAHSEAKQMAALRLVVGAFAPAAIQYETPYAPMVDKYRELLKTDPVHAQERFLDLYGEDYFHLTQAFTKLNNGIPATVQGDQQYEKYKAMVQRYPELGGLITGEDGGGSAAQFSAAVYQKQRTTPIRPGSDVMMRTPLSAEEIIQQDDSRLGWIKFTRAMDLIDAEMANRGLPNINVKAATDLRTLKDLITSAIALKHPQWYAEYTQRNDVVWDNKIAAMHEITKDPQLIQRPDIQMLKQYLDVRSALMAELAARPSADINAQTNVDLRTVWDALIQKMKTGTNGLAFSSLYNRWLIHDPLSSVGINTIGVNNGLAVA